MATRREFLVGTAAAVAVVATGAPLTNAAPAITPPVFPAWEVGTPGDMDWKVVFAPDERSARLEWLKLSHGIDGEMPCVGPCSPDGCACYGGEFDDKLPPARRAPYFDDPHMDEPSDAKKLECGWTICCDRCGYETTAEENALNINETVVCLSCATPAEIKAHDVEEYEHWLYNDNIEEAEPGDKAALLARYAAEDALVT